MIVTMNREQYLLFFAIEMWVKTFLILCDENGSSSHAIEYSHFVANANEPQLHSEKNYICPKEKI